MSADIRAALRGRRKTVGLTQEQLGFQLGRDQATISDYETGRSNPSLRSLLRLADALGCDVVLVPRDRKPRTEYAWCKDGTPDDGVPVTGQPDLLRSLAARSAGAVYVREVTDWRPEETS